VTLVAGTRLGPYEVVAPLGAGGMGEVYRARDARLSREVAIKVLPAEIASDTGRLERFEKEARAASSLNHPNIVTIYDIGVSDSHSYIAMELVEGKTVRELLHAGPLPLRRLLSLAAQIADGLAKAHAAAIVHRDLKPENLMVTKDGFVKILDFGLAKLIPAGFEAAESQNAPTVTRGTEPGAVLGTVGYMSPEQASGQLVDFRSDQFSLGAILYEMASGKRAFERATAVQTLSAIIQDEPEPLSAAAPKVPANLLWIIERCLAKDPEERYAASKDLARDLAALRDHLSGISAAGEGPALSRRRRLAPLPALGALVAAAILAFSAGRYLEARRDRARRPPRYTQITYRKGHVTGGRFAADGQTVVYSGSWGGNASEIFETRIGQRESRPLRIFPAGILAVSSLGEMAISLGCEDLWDPCFGTLARVPLAGGAPREVLEGVLSADWSPDGQKVAVSRRVEGGFSLEYPLGKTLYRTPGWLGSVRVSPDGASLAFIEHPSLDSIQGRVCFMDAAGKKKNLTPELPEIGALAWKPGSREILFDHARGEGGRFAGLHVVDLSGRIREIYSPVDRLWDVSPDGRVLVEMGETRAEILALPPGGVKERNLSWFDTSVAADISADGRNLLFGEGEGADSAVSVYYRRTDGSESKRLGDGKPLALSPDQRWALTLQRTPKARLVLLPTGAGEQKILPDGGADLYYWATWFSDSHRILFVARQEGKRRSYVQDMDGGPPRPVLRDGLLATLVSPDGKFLAATGVDGGAYLCGVDGKEERPIAGVLPDDDLVQWGGDGNSLFVRGSEKDTLTLFRVDLKTGKRELWKTLTPPDRVSFLEFGSGPRGVRLTPDGGSYAYTCWTRLTSLGIIEGLK
jgi:WD40 repeat protein